MKKTPIQNKKTEDDAIGTKLGISRYILKCTEVFAAEERLTRKAATELFLTCAVDYIEGIRSRKLR